MLAMTLAYLLPAVVGSKVQGPPAGWTWTDISAGTDSIANYTYNGQTVGVTSISGFDSQGVVVGRATIWSGQFPIDVTPGGATDGTIYRTDGNHQVGASDIDGRSIATVWTGTSGYQFLGNVLRETGAFAWGLYGSREVGEHTVSGAMGIHAWIWDPYGQHDLQPAGWDQGSRAVADNGFYQVGAAATSAFPAAHACTWNGSAGTFQDRNPVGFDGSTFLDVRGTVGVGMAYHQSGQVVSGRQAYVWNLTTRGIPYSIHPSGYSESIAVGVDVNLIAGEVITSSGAVHAYLWDRLAGTQLDLSSILPPGYYGNSKALSCYRNGTSGLDVCGYAIDLTTGLHHAMLWQWRSPG